MTTAPKRIGSLGKTAGVKTSVSVPKNNSTTPRKKNDKPTVTMITVSVGSPMSGCRNSRSVSSPRIAPMTSVSSTDNKNGIPHW